MTSTSPSESAANPSGRPSPETAAVRRLRDLITPVTAICLFLGLWGCLAIFNASASYEHPLGFAARQLVWLVFAMGVLMLASVLRVRAYRALLPAVAMIAYSLLWLVLVGGVRINGMQGWFTWNGVFLQPGEIAKPAFLLSLAWLHAKLELYRDSFWKGYLPLLALFALWAAPIALEPDFGTLLVYALSFLALAWAMGARPVHLAATALAGLPVVAVCMISKPYVQHRFLGFMRPDQYAETYGWHVLQFQRTLAQGGLWGCSWGKGTWSQNYLPLGHSDSIFASVAESVGFAGVVPLILLIVAWIFYGLNKARRAEDGFSRAVITGMVAMLGIQSLLHLSVNLGLFPPTGITLPLISYGGSSLISSMMAFGIVEAMVRSSPPAATAAPQSAALPGATGGDAPMPAGHGR